MYEQLETLSYFFNKSATNAITHINRINKIYHELDKH